MEKVMDKDLLTKFKAGAQGQDAAWLREFLDLLHYWHEEFATEPLGPQVQAALKKGREALRRGDRSYFTPGEEVKNDLGL